MNDKPTIKGIFVNSHIKAVHKQRGDEGLRELEVLYGKDLKFRNSENVPIAEEVKIIEYALDILSETPIDPGERAFEAGRLHFRNFATTPLGRIIFSIYRKDFQRTMLKSQNIAGHVFQGVRFTAVETGPKELKIIMENNDYPLDHFRGLFFEWMHFSGSKGTVEAQETTQGRFEYLITWQ